MAQDESWSRRLNEVEADELRTAVATLKATGKPLLETRRDDFPLPSLQRRIAALRLELEDGRGFELWRGLPVDNWNSEERQIAFWGLGLHVGAPVVQHPFTSTEPTSSGSCVYGAP